MYNNPSFFTDSGYISLDGSNDYIQAILYGVNIDSTCTIEGWMKRRSTPSAWRTFFNIKPESSNTPFFEFRSGGNQQHIYADYYSGVDNNTPSATFTTGEWGHAVATYDGSGNIKMHFNGELVGTKTGVPSFALGDNPRLTIGRAYSDDRYTDINVKSIKIYNKALSATEVAQNYYGGPIVTNGLIFAVDGSNLVSYENGSATAYSLTGSNGGTLTNGVSFSDENGGVLYFDGSNDYIEFTDNYIGTELAISSAQDYTLEAWIKVETSSGTTTSAATIVGQTSSTGYGFQVGESGGKPRMNYGARSTSNFYSSTFEYNEWIHVTLVKLPNAGCRSFLNGELDVTYGSDLRISSPSDGALRLGNASNRVTGYYDGAIGPVRIYNRALTDDEVLQNFNAQKSRFGL